MCKLTQFKWTNFYWAWHSSAPTCCYFYHIQASIWYKSDIYRQCFIKKNILFKIYLNNIGDKNRIEYPFVLKYTPKHSIETPIEGKIDLIQTRSDTTSLKQTQSGPKRSGSGPRSAESHPFGRTAQPFLNYTGCNILNTNLLSPIKPCFV